MFTIKYRTFQPSAAQDSNGPTNYDTCEQLSGPYDLISQEMEDGYPVIYAHSGDHAGTTFGPIKSRPDETDQPEASSPRPTLWVMNDVGATVATYHL